MSECSRWRQDGDDSKFHIAAEHDMRVSVLGGNRKEMTASST